MKYQIYLALLLAICSSCRKDHPKRQIMTFTLKQVTPSSLYVNYFAGINGTTITINDTSTWISEKIVITDSMHLVSLDAWAKTPEAGNVLKSAINIDGKVVKEAIGDSASVHIDYTFQ